MVIPNYFPKMSKLVVGNVDIPQIVADKIYEFHIQPMNIVRYYLGSPIWASEESCFRPYLWEIARGRSGNSQHCFGQKKDNSIDKEAKGAADWTCDNFAESKDKLLELIIKHTSYTRIAVYDTFIHCDYKAIDGKRYIYSSTPSSKWTLKKIL